VFRNYNNKLFGRHKLKLGIIFLVIAFGTSVHLILDAILNGVIMPLFPFYTFQIGFDLAGYLPEPLDSLLIPSLDAILLVLWLAYLELKHKISDFI